MRYSDTEGAFNRPFHMDISNPMFRMKFMKDPIKKTILMPTPDYFLIVGETGTGKTTLMKSITVDVKEKENNRGIIYVNVEDPSLFGEDFADLIGFDFSVERSYSTLLGDLIMFGPTRHIVKPKDVKSQVSRSLFHLKRVLMKMEEQRTNLQKEKRRDENLKLMQKLPVIIIDNCDRLAEEQPETLKSLQNIAKDWIDHQLALFVFVSSEGNTETIMKDREVASRMEILRIHELDRENAIEFLKSRKIPKEDAEKIESITGGLFKYLNRAVKIYNRTKGNIQNIQQEIVSGLESDYEKAQNLNSEDVVEKAVNELLKKKDKSLGKLEFRDSIFGKEMDSKYGKFKELMKGNVFSQENGVVRFQNRAMGRYLEGRTREKSEKQ